MAKRRIALAQLVARELADASLALDEALDAVRQAGAAGADLCVLPEGTYPGYVLGSVEAGRAALRAGPDPTAALGAAARDAEIQVIAGLVLPEGEGLLNAAVHFDRLGRVRNRVAKRFLWHFDRAWYVQGGESDVCDGVGVLVCADGRLPEISAGLASKGASLLVNSTAWVVSRPAPLGTNAQAEFLWRVRALESGVAAVACTKVGTEGGVAMYAGKSQAVAPDGSVIAAASPTDPELLVVDVDVPDRPAPPVARRLDMPDPRCPEPMSGHVYVAVVTDDSLLSAVAEHGCQLVVGPEGVQAVEALSVKTLVDDDLLVPGPARAAAFAGAHVLVWMARSVSSPFVCDVARSRALENRVFVVVWRRPTDGGPFIVGPTGAILASAPRDRDFAVGASILPNDAVSKEVAPGSDLFEGAADVLGIDG